MTKELIKALMNVVLQVKNVRMSKLLIDSNDESEMLKAWKDSGKKTSYMKFRDNIVKLSIDELDDIPTTCKKLLDK